LNATPDTLQLLRTAAVPAELTSFVGRSREIADLTELLLGSRLLTLTGAGGSGKTRLAGALASAWTREPVAWVELAPIEDESLVPAAIAEALGRSEELRRPDGETLGRIVGPAPLLLILDNCEHVVDRCAAVVDHLLRACPGLRVLSTSREPLGVQGERSWLVPALSLPEADASGDALASEAVRLFVERAREVAPDFALTEGNSAAVVEVCRRLDGIPLAIELAAARIKVLRPEEIRARLDDAFGILSSPRRTGVPRHRTLRATMDWSHALLAEPERVLLRRLAVFRGGATLDAVEAVGLGEPLEEGEILDTLARLVDRSLVTVREHEGASRYFLLETVRQYAAERLVASEELEIAHRRHLAHFLAVAREADPHFRGAERPHWIRRLLPDIDNFRDALAWSRVHDEAGHVRLVGALGWFWFSTRHWNEANQWTAAALEIAEAAVPGRERAALLFAAGYLAALQARPGEARPWLEECVALAGEAGDPTLEAYALTYLGMVHGQVGGQEGVEVCRRAAAWFDDAGDLYGHRLCRLLLGTMAALRGDMDEALRENLEGVRLARLFGMPRELGISLQNTGMVHIHRGEMDLAEARVRESLEQFRLDPSHLFVATSLDYLGEVLGQGGRLLDAARLFGAGEALREMVGAARFPINERRVAARIPVFQAAAGEAPWREAWAEGRVLVPDRIMEALPPPSASPAPPSAPVITQAHAGSAPDALEEAAGHASLHLAVRALGPFEARVEGGAFEVERWSWAKPREALLYLLLHREGATRDGLGAALWPDTPPSRLKNSFHVALHHLRKSLDHPEWIVLKGDRYCLAPGLRTWLDAHAFEAAVRDAGSDPEALRSALALWRGVLLEGEAVGSWVDDHRDRLGRLADEAWLTLGTALEDSGADEEAAEAFHTVVLRDPLREDAHRSLMAAWVRLGQRARALRHFDDLCALLHAELDAAPEAETVALAEQLRQGRA
jgi:predicted ATPase/DNA-binding SARP family transcriptional activator